jgi:RNA polymerase sigma-70 factor (ECF subfamily)
MRMHEYEGATFESIASRLGMQPAAVRMQISRARKLIREKYENEYEGL